MKSLILILKWFIKQFLFRQVINGVNKIGQPKVKENTISNETITAIKVSKRPQPKEENKWALPTNNKGKSGEVKKTNQVNSNSGMSTNYSLSTGAVTNPYAANGQPGSNGTDGNQGTTASYGAAKKYINVGGKLFDPNTFEEVSTDSLNSRIYVGVDYKERLSDILKGGDNVIPTEDWDNPTYYN
jgi:hypothetical protein